MKRRVRGKDTKDAAHCSPLEARRLSRDFTRVPETAGVYFIYFRHSSQLLKGGRTDLSYAQNGAQLLYIGATQHSLRARIKSHLVGTTRASSLRGTLGVLLRKELGLQSFPQAMHFHFGPGEERLTKWILDNALVAYAVLDDAMTVEKALIRILEPPLNISSRRTQPSARRLLSLRSRKRFQGNTRSPEYYRFNRWRQYHRDSTNVPQYYSRLLPRSKQGRA